MEDINIEWPEFETDHCLDEEIANLKNEGITIHFFNCDRIDRFIVTSNRDISKMKELGYKINGQAYSGDKIYKTYEPKSICTFEEDDENDNDNNDEEDLEIMEELEKD